MRKIYFIDFALHMGGAEISLEQLINSLGNIEPEVLTHSNSPLIGRLKCPIKTVNIPQVQLKQNKSGFRAAISFASIFSKGYNTDMSNTVLVSNTFKAHIFAFALKLFSTGCIWIIAERDMPENSMIKLIKDIMHYISDITVYNSDFLESAYRKCNSAVISNPIVKGTGAEKPDLNRFVFAGSMSKQKGADRFMDVMRRLKAVIPGAYAHVYGMKPPYRGSVELKGTKNVEIKGYADRDEIFGRGGYIMLFPRVKESFARVIAEGMAYGMIPVVIKGNGTDDYVSDKNGIIIDGFDADKIAGRILEVKASGMENQLIQNAEDTARSFEPSIIADKWEKLLKGLLA